MNHIASTQFDLEDQKWFANLSGDHNPLHIDPLYARRLVFGTVVVHGIHLVIWAMNEIFKNTQSHISINKLQVLFRSPVRVGDEIALKISDSSSAEKKITLLSNGAQVALIKMTTAPISPDEFSDVLPLSIQKDTICHDFKPSDLIDKTGRIPLYIDVDAMRQRYADLIDVVPVAQIAELIATTRIVGMECPGLHSVYSELFIEKTDTSQTDAMMNYIVSEYDDRFSLTNIAFKGRRTAGRIKAFVRPEPASQIQFNQVSQHVIKNEFEDQTALIIGGSRGLGEVTAKLLLVGGACVTATYYKGSKDIEKLQEGADEVGFKFDSFNYDILNPGQDIIAYYGDRPLPTHLYYFATPFIFEGNKFTFSQILFDKFCDYYVKGFMNTFATLTNLGAPLKYIFSPSSIAVENLIPELGEYAAAKAAGESVCEFLRKTQKRVKVECPRLPRIETDQTVSISPVHNEQPVPIILKYLRSI